MSSQLDVIKANVISVVSLFLRPGPQTQQKLNCEAAMPVVVSGTKNVGSVVGELCA